MRHFVSFGFGPPPAVTNQLKAAGGKNATVVAAVRGCCHQTVGPRRHISQVASGFLDQDRHAFLLLAVLLGELRKLHFQNPQHPWPWVVLAISEHQLSSFQTWALLRRVTLSSLSNSFALASQPPSKCPSNLSSKLSGLLLFSSIASLAPSWRIAAFLFAILTSVFLQVGHVQRPSFCFLLS